MIGVYCSPARISSHLNYWCNHRGKEKTKGLSECRQAGETTGGPRQVCFDFLYGRKRLSRRVTDGIVVCRREKKILWESCTCSGGSPLFWLYYNYYLILYSSNGKHKKKEKKKFVRIQTHVFLACLAVVSVHIQCPAFRERRRGWANKAADRTAFGTNKARHVWLLGALGESHHHQLNCRVDGIIHVTEIQGCI